MAKNSKVNEPGESRRGSARAASAKWPSSESWSFFALLGAVRYSACPLLVRRRHAHCAQRPNMGEGAQVGNRLDTDSAGRVGSGASQSALVQWRLAGRAVSWAAPAAETREAQRSLAQHDESGSGGRVMRRCVDGAAISWRAGAPSGEECVATVLPGSGAGEAIARVTTTRPRGPKWATTATERRGRAANMAARRRVHSS